MSKRSDLAEKITHRLLALNDAVLNLDVQLALHEASILETSERLKPLLSRISDTCVTLDTAPKSLQTKNGGEEKKAAHNAPSMESSADCEKRVSVQ